MRKKGEPGFPCHVQPMRVRCAIESWGYFKMFDDDRSAAERLDFKQIGDLVADSLTASGYHLMRMESQEWAVQYSLDSENMDGSAVIFFGPTFRRSSDLVELPYLIIGPETRRGEVSLAQDADSTAVASALLDRFHEVLVDLFQTPHFHDAGVGVGLVPVDKFIQ